VVDSTPPAPIPPLIATAHIEVERLRAALLEVGAVAELSAQRETLLLTGFAVPREVDYDVFDGILAVSHEYEGTW
jgi:hypothetical protein